MTGEEGEREDKGSALKSLLPLQTQCGAFLWMLKPLPGHLAFPFWYSWEWSHRELCCVQLCQKCPSLSPPRGHSSEHQTPSRWKKWQSQNRFRHVAVEMGTEQERSLLFMHPGPESTVTCTGPLLWEGFRAQKQPGKDTKVLTMLSNTLKSASSF